MNKRYLALTTGPIYKTLAATKKTRQLWGASYFFSYLMREIIQKVKNEKIIVPYVSDEILTAKTGAGLFPDVLLIKSESLSLEDFKAKIDEVIDFLAQKSEGEVTTAALKKYLQMYCFECELESTENPVLVLQSYLNAMEQMPVYQREETVSLVAMFDKLNGKLFYSDAGHGFNFPSIADIATHDLKLRHKVDYEAIANRISDEDDQKLLAALSKNEKIKKDIRNYHNYIAIVQADGDRIGKTIGNIGNNEKLMQQFSKDLFEYSMEALKKIKEYGGEAVFAGGDDLLFFAPLANASKGQTVLHLIQDVIDAFDKKITKNDAYKIVKDNKETRPTMSFGVSVSYYKFPLGESREQACTLLFNKAKKTRNCIALDLKKHSHSGTEIDLLLENADSKVVKNLINDLLSLQLSDKSDAILHSIAQIFSQQKAPLKTLLDDEPNRALRLGYFFRENFNESIHKPYHAENGFFTKLKASILAAVVEYDNEKGLKIVEQIIDIQHFIHRKIKK